MICFKPHTLWWFVMAVLGTNTNPLSCSLFPPNFHLLFLLLWKRYSQHRICRLPRGTPWLVDENVRKLYLGNISRKLWPWFYPVFSIMTTPFPHSAPSHLDSWMPALIASGECTTKSWFWVYSVKQRRITMGGREQSSGLEGQITKDRWKQGPLSGSHLGTGLWYCGAEGSAPSTQEVQTQSRGDQGRREMQAWWMLLPPLAEWDVC